MIFLGLLLAGGVLFAFIIYILYLRDLPSIHQIESGGLSESTIIYDKNGQELYTMHNAEGRRTYVPYSDISQTIKDAIVSAEDKTFFSNPGIDIF
jgi:penicillin-binding protein 1A